MLHVAAKRLGSMLTQQRDVGGGSYNEIVFNVTEWVLRFPRTIEAVFIQPTHIALSSRLRGEGRSARRLLEEYGIELRCRSSRSNPTAMGPHSAT